MSRKSQRVSGDMMMVERFAPVSRVAEMYDTSISHIYEMVERGDFPPGVIVRIGPKIRFSIPALRRWQRRTGKSMRPRKRVAEAGR